jgi:FtsP/CotA-like multicopper oxidase with cupredoxin domain
LLRENVKNIRFYVAPLLREAIEDRVGEGNADDVRIVIVGFDGSTHTTVGTNDTVSLIRSEFNSLPKASGNSTGFGITLDSSQCSSPSPNVANAGECQFTIRLAHKAYEAAGGTTTIRPPEESGTIGLNDESEQDGTSDNSDDNSNDNNDAPVEEKERDNEIYTVNGKAFDYVNNPIQLKVGQKYRIYVVNMLEFDLINSLHVHGAMFEYYPAGTSMSPQDSFVHDVIELGQGDRGIMELEYKYPGQYMFHAHVTEFTDLGWMGFFNVAAKGGNSTINSSSNNETTAMTGHTSDKVGPHQDLSPVFPYFK